MIAAIGIMIGLYIITRMLELLSDKKSRLLIAFAYITLTAAIAVTVMMVLVR